MKRMLILAVVIVLAAGLTWFAGCSNKATNPTTVAGDTTAVGFQMMRSMAQDGILSFDGNLVDISLSLQDSIPGIAKAVIPFKPAVPTVNVIQIISYDTSNYWHIFHVSAIYADSVAGDSIIFSGYDSLRFAKGSEFVYIPDSAVTGLDIRAHFSVSLITLNATLTLNNHAALNLTGTYQGALTINGATSDTLLADIVTDSGACGLDLSLNQAYAGVHFDSAANPAGECPSAGKVTMNATMDLACAGGSSMADSLNVNGAWDMGFVFNSGQVTATYRHNGVQWVVTDNCGPGPAKEGWVALAKAIQNIKR